MSNDENPGIELSRITCDESTRIQISAFLCKICNNLPYYGVNICNNTQCGEYICNFCLSSQDSSCPLCKSTTNNFKNMLIKASHKIQVDCKFKSEGCPEKLVIFELNNHEAKCIFKEVKCASELCTFKSSLKSIQDHEKVCPNFIIKCDNCGESLIRNQQTSHNEKCLECICECSYCHQNLKRAQIKEHYENCEEYEVNCDKCMNRYTRSKQKEHSCLSSVNENLIQNYKVLDERITNLEKKISRFDTLFDGFESRFSLKLQEIEEKVTGEIRRMNNETNNQKKILKSESLTNKKLEENLVPKEIADSKSELSKLSAELENIKTEIIIKKILCLSCENRVKTIQCKSCNIEFCNSCITKCKNCSCETCLECIRMSPNCKENCTNVFCKNCFEKKLDDNDSVNFNTKNFFKCMICNQIHCKTCANNKKCKICSIIICSECLSKCKSCENDICSYCFKYYDPSIHSNSKNDFLKNCTHLNSPNQYIPLVLGGYDGKTINFNLLNSKIMNTLSIHSSKSYVTSLTKFNDKVISASSDGVLKVWKDFSMSSKFYEYSNNEKNNQNTYLVNVAVINESLFASSCLSKKNALLFYSDNINTVKPIKKLEIDNNVSSLAKLNENLVALGGSNVSLWYLPKNEIISRLNVHEGYQIDNIMKLKKTVYSNGIASTASDFKLKIWNERGKVLVSFDDANIASSNYCKINELHDGRVLASSNDYLIKIFDLKSKDIIAYKNHSYFVHDFAVLNEFCFVSCSGDYSICTWDIRKNEKLMNFTLEDFYPILMMNPYID